MAKAFRLLGGWCYRGELSDGVFNFQAKSPRAQRTKRGKRPTRAGMRQCSWEKFSRFREIVSPVRVTMVSNAHASVHRGASRLCVVHGSAI